MRLAGAYALVAAIVAVVFAVAILTGPFRAVERSDYMTYHVAARIVLDGDGACLYLAACQAAAQEDLIGEEPSFEGGALPYNSPPWLAAIVTPLGLLPLHLGFVLFTLVGLLVLAAGAWRLTPLPGSARILGPILVLTAWPTVMAAIRGQSTLLAVGLLALSVSASRYRSGLALGLAALKPTLTPLWALWQLLGGHVRAVGTGLAVVVGYVALAAVVVSPQALLDYPAHLLGVSGANAVGVHPEEMVNWRGVAERVGAGWWLVVGGSLLTLGMVAGVWISTSSRKLGAAAAFLATPLVIPHANQHEAVLAIVGILLAIAGAHALRRTLVLAAFGLHAVLWAGPLLTAEMAAWSLFLAQLVWLVAVVLVAWVEWRPLTGGTEPD